MIMSYDTSNSCLNRAENFNGEITIFNSPDLSSVDPPESFNT